MPTYIVRRNEELLYAGTNFVEATRNIPKLLTPPIHYSFVSVSLDENRNLVLNYGSDVRRTKNTEIKGLQKLVLPKEDFRILLERYDREQLLNLLRS